MAVYFFPGPKPEKTVTETKEEVSFVGAQFWILACMVVAVRQALDYKSLWKAFGVVFLSGFIISLVSVLIIFILK